MRNSRLPPDTPIAVTPDEFRRLGYDLVDRIGEFLESLPARPVTPQAGAAEMRALLDAAAPLPEHGGDPAALLAEASALLFDNSTFNAHPLFFGYITAGPTPIGILGDFLASAVNPNCGSWTLAPMATEIESQTIRWIADLIGYPTDCGGILVSGGNVANFTCFLAARVAAADWPVREQGLRAEEAQHMAVYASAETHTWISKAADLYGLGTDSIRWIETDGAQRMRVDALRAALDRDAATGVQPLMVVGTAGSVSTGAVDPLGEIADLCAEHGIWFHIDGAYGGLAAAVPDASPELAHLGRADSIAVDPHKWLYAPLEAGCAIVRDADALRHAFSYHPPYYHFGVEATNYVDFGQQNSRGFRALKIWLALRHAGRAGYRRMIADDIALAAHLFDQVSRHAELEPATLNLSIATFRYVPAALSARVGEPAAEAELNRINEELLDRLQKGGEAFVSNAVIGGRYLLRACVVNFNTTRADVEALPEIIVRTGRAVERDLALPA